jgi:hypothetical protein
MPGPGLFFREMGDNSSISQIMKKSIPYIQSMFRSFVVIVYLLLLFIPRVCFYSLCPCKS